jgi:haloalkane dehalogenase
VAPGRADAALAAVPAAHPWLDVAEYPFAPRRFETPDGALSYIDEGSGPAVLFVHGTPSWSFEWRAVIRSLRDRYRCVAVDHLGFGLSEKPASAPLAPPDHARRLRALVEALDLRDLTLVVHDFGGPIGLPLAIEAPERVARVIAINTWMWPSDGDRALRKMDRVIRGPVGRFLYRWLNFSPRVLLPSTFAVRSRLTPALHRQYLMPFARRADREGPYQLARALVGADPHYAALWARRAELAEKPLTVLWGMKDPALSERYLKMWVDAFASAKVVQVADAGHFVAEERPDAVVDAIRGS